VVLLVPIKAGREASRPPYEARDEPRRRASLHFGGAPGQTREVI